MKFRTDIKNFETDRKLNKSRKTFMQKEEEKSNNIFVIKSIHNKLPTIATILEYSPSVYKEVLM